MDYGDGESGIYVLTVVLSLVSYNAIIQLSWELTCMPIFPITILVTLNLGERS